ncbi:MAG: cytochrome c oxidase assembly protein [Alphaproteobacteria bacterium]|nr:cytochrome c oxidase assembly protein [Alphaproteobacteria bacterium]
MADRRRNRRIAAALVAVPVAMGALAWASAPLYRLFCQVTGFGGTPGIAAEAPQAAADAPSIEIRFNADIAPDLDWRFGPVERAVTVRLGEPALAFYRAENLGEEPVTGAATFNVTPLKAGAYFSKIDCFCFTEQRLGPGESADMPVSFFVDPEIADDPNVRDVGTITLSYTFFRSEEEPAPNRQQADAANVTNGGVSAAAPRVANVTNGGVSAAALTNREQTHGG